MVGKIHTAEAGNHAIDIPLVQMNALMGFVADAVNATILGADIPAERAFGKLLWLQNDLMTRHYAAEPARAAAGGDPERSGTDHLF